jgi:2OG-Fe(II) oxygenase superfamily
MAPVIGIDGSGSRLLEFSPGSQAGRAELRREFVERDCAVLRGFLQPALLEELLPHVERSGFRQRAHGHIGTEDSMEAGGPLASLLLAANDPRLFEFVMEVTGCGAIGCFDGRVYRLDPARGHGDSWHSDVGDNRLVAMSVNLTPGRYEGGVLQIRDQLSGEVTAEVDGTALGDAVIFRIAERLRHRVSQVKGDVPRIAFAGWFKSAPTFRSVLAGGQWTAPGRT